MTTSCLAKKIIFKQNSKIIFIDSAYRPSTCKTNIPTVERSWFVKGEELPPMPEQVYVCLKKPSETDMYPEGFLLYDNNRILVYKKISK